MKKSIHATITAMEERLREAMLQSDVDALSELLSPELLFTNHLGHVLSKDDDLAAHRSGALTIKELTLSEQRIQAVNTVAIVSVRVRLEGTYGGEPASGDFRFTRVWGQGEGDAWRVVAGHSTLIA